MFLYELAIESGMRSRDLVDLAAHVGLGEVSPSTALTRAQADTLLAAARTGGGTGPAQPDQPPGDPPPSEPGVWSGPLPPPPASTPATGQPPSRPGVWSSSLPSPPASSHVGAPPPGMPALDAPPPPAGWGPPPPAPSSYGAPLTAGPDGAAPAPPVASLIGSPTVGPLASWLPPSPRADGPGEGFPPPPKTKSARSQMVIVVAAALAAVALLGYMAMNIGPDEGQKREAAAAQRRADAATPTTFTAPPTTNTTTTPSATTGPDSNTFADPGRFCRGIRFTSAFFLRVVAGTLERDWQGQKVAATDGRPAWNSAVEDMLAGASPRLRPDIEFYRDQYVPFLDRLTASNSASDVAAAGREVDLAGLRGVHSRLLASVGRACS